MDSAIAKLHRYSKNINNNENNNNYDSITTELLPQDLWMQIIENLELDSLQNLSEVCHTLNQYCGEYITFNYERSLQKSRSATILSAGEKCSILHRYSRLNPQACDLSYFLNQEQSYKPIPATALFYERKAILQQQFSDAVSIRMHSARCFLQEVQYWTHAGAGFILVTVMACMLYSCDATASSWMGLRILVGAFFTVTVAIGASKQQEQRERRRRKKQQEEEEEERISNNKKSLQRSKSVAGDLAFFGSEGYVDDYSSTTLYSSLSSPDLTQYESDSLWKESDAADIVTSIIDPLAPPGETRQGDESNDRKDEYSVNMHPRPRGYVGAFRKAISQAKHEIEQSVNEERRKSFDAMTPEEQTELSTALIDACTDDSSLEAVKVLAMRVPVDAFYVGSDGTESCPLHIAAFHGAVQVLEYLCRGIDYDNSNNDGGLCNVNLQDANGWTALHFAAGGNNARAVRTLLQHGADPDVVAVNGYTPLQWAQRLQHTEVVEELDQPSPVSRCRQLLSSSSIMIMVGLLLIPNLLIALWYNGLIPVVPPPSPMYLQSW